MAGRPLRREREARNNGRWRPTPSKKTSSPTPFLVLWVDPSTLSHAQIRLDTFSEPGAWGIMLADTFVHLLHAASQQGKDLSSSGKELLEAFEYQNGQLPRIAGARSGEPILTAWLDQNRFPNFQIRTGVFQNFGSWGIMLSDIVNSIAKRFAQEGRPFDVTKEEIIEFFFREIENPGGTPTGGISHGMDS